MPKASQSYRKDRRDFIVYCFKELSDAQLSQMHFDGELMTAETRPPKYPNAKQPTGGE